MVFKSHKNTLRCMKNLCRALKDCLRISQKKCIKNVKIKFSSYKYVRALEPNLTKYNNIRKILLNTNLWFINIWRIELLMSWIWLWCSNRFRWMKSLHFLEKYSLQHLISGKSRIRFPLHFYSWMFYENNSAGNYIHLCVQ